MTTREDCENFYAESANCIVCQDHTRLHCYTGRSQGEQPASPSCATSELLNACRELMAADDEIQEAPSNFGNLISKWDNAVDKILKQTRVLYGNIGANAFGCAENTK